MVQASEPFENRTYPVFGSPLYYDSKPSFFRKITTSNSFMTKNVSSHFPKK